MPAFQDDDLSPNARLVAAALLSRWGIQLSASPIQPRPGLAPLATQPVAQAQHAIEVLVSMALESGNTYLLEQTGDRARLCVADASMQEGIRVLSRFNDLRPIHELLELLGADLAQDTQISQVVTLANDTEVYLTVRRYSAQSLNGEVNGYELSAVPARAPSLPLDDLGITQVDRWREAVNRNNGLCVVHGHGMRTTLRATAAELEATGARVMWVDQVTGNEDLNALGADVYVFRRPLRRRMHLQMAAELAKDATVLVSMHARSASEVLKAFNDVDLEDEDLAEVLNATLLQVIVSHADDAQGLQPGEGEPTSMTLLSELVFFDGIDDIDSLKDGDLPMRHLAIDAAEKVRWDEISEETARSIVGDVLYNYL